MQIVNHLMEDMASLKRDAEKWLVKNNKKDKTIKRYKETILKTQKNAKDFGIEFNIEHIYEAVAQSAIGKSKNEQGKAILQIGFYALAYDELKLKL